ncbi:MAG: type II toxin-antitoxin system RelE/ParE family toxin [Alphaproteobacteria bacterium]
MTRPFSRFARSEDIDDDALFEAVARAERGLIDADLGGGVIKQRIARRGEGRSGGFRTIILFRRGELAFFVYGFAKSDRDNIRGDELRAFRKLAGELLRLDEDALSAALANGTITEVQHHD